jgi:cytochrome c-type biogenesis protein
VAAGGAEKRGTMSVESLVYSGPLLLALPVAAAAGAVTFLSPCCLPLVPGYLAYITGMSGADASADQPSGARVAIASDGTAPAAVAVGGVATVTAAPAATSPAPARGRMVAGTALFVLGFSLVFTLLGMTVGGVSQLLHAHAAVITQALGGVTLVLGLLFLGAFDRFTFAGRIVKPSMMPRAGLAGAPLLGVLFGIGWTPCIGPTLTAVQTLSFSSGTAARGALIALVYALGLGIPFLVVAALFQRTVNVLAFFKRHLRLIARVGGILLIALGLVEATGTWTLVVAWMHTHWFQTYSPQL